MDFDIKTSKQFVSNLQSFQIFFNKLNKVIDISYLLKQSDKKKTK